MQRPIECLGLGGFVLLVAFFFDSVMGCPHLNKTVQNIIYPYIMVYSICVHYHTRRLGLPEVEI